jgi:hypothetical protein
MFLIAIWIAVAVVLFIKLYSSDVGYECALAIPVAVIGASLATGATWLVDCSDPK